MLRSLRLLFAKQDDPYAGADLNLARRLGSWFWIVNCLLAIALWPLSPIDRRIGSPGWLIGDALIIAALAFALALRSDRLRLNFTGVLVSCYVGALGIGVMQWLAGGGSAPYDGLLLNQLLLVSATNPLRRMTPFVAFIGALLFAPVVYGGFQEATAAKALSEFVIWAPLAGMVFLMMSSIRQQRISMRRGEKEAREEARVDELTTISNRRAFEEALLEEISRADRMDTPLSMAMGDIEHFKQINDRFGHLEGDRALHKVAQAMDSELRIPDRVFRWGGDEFALLLPGTSQADADVVIARLQEKVCETCTRPDGDPIFIHYAAAELQPGMNATQFTEAADMELMAERARDHRTRV
jgi:diguanylate cyclase (GGDEF)-like protein